MLKSFAFLPVCHILLNQSGQQIAPSDWVIMLAKRRESISGSDALIYWGKAAELLLASLTKLARK